MRSEARQALLAIDPEHLQYAKPEELELYRRALEIEAHLASPLDYAVYCSKAKRYRHIRLLNLWLMALIQGRLYFDGPGPAPIDSGEVDEEGRPILVHPERGDSPVYNLAISMPPRHGKSYLVSEHLPAWFLTVYPHYSVLLASYEADFASKWGAKARDHIVAHPELGVEVAGGHTAARREWDLDGHRGFMKCAGAGGPLTGSGGQLMIVDDPIKNAEEALSAAARENLDDWWHSTFYTRREPWDDGTPARCILMATRWHEDDLTGRRVPTVPKMGDRWALLNLMALFEPTSDQPVDPLGRAEGEALCPERFTAATLKEIRQENAKSRQWFTAMYQGQPALEDGNLIKRPFNYYRYRMPTEDEGGVYVTTDEEGRQAVVPEEDCYRYGTLDPAGTDKKQSDYTVLTVVDVSRETPRRAFIHSVERVKVDSDNHEQLVLHWYDRYKLQAIHVENKTFGSKLIRRLMNIPRIVVAKLEADANKVHRAMPVKYEIENRLLWFPESAEWLSEFERELLKFPYAKHDDQTDSLAYAVQVFKELPPWIERKREPVTTEEKLQAHRRKIAQRNKPGRRRIPGLGRW